MSNKDLKNLVGTSETTRENIMSPLLSIHRPDHKYPDATQIGYYLAGLIDGDGWICKEEDQPKIVIAFHKKDIHVGYYLKSFFNNGTIKEHITKQSATLTFTNKIALVKICSLIHNKIKIKEKIKRLNSLISRLPIVSTVLSPSIRPPLYENLDKNHYLAGLIDADGCLTIRLLDRVKRNKTEVRLYLRMDLLRDPTTKNDSEDIIKEFKSVFGGQISFPRKHMNNLSSSYSLSYNSVSFKNMYKVLKYLDEYNLNSKYLEYTYLRKAYLIVQDKRHLEEEGLNLIKEYQLKMSKLK